MRSRGFFLLVLAVSVVAATTRPTAADAVTFSDSTFDDVDWTATVAHDTSPNPGATSFSAGQVATGGSGEPPDSPYRFTDIDWIGPGGPFIGHLLSGATWDPASQGAIARIDASFEVNVFNAPFIGGTSVRPAARQDGTWYRSFEPFIATLNSWTSKDFNDISFNKFGAGPGGSTLDTTFFGAPIEFGYVVNVNPSSPAILNNLSGVDNWTLTVTPIAVPALPVWALASVAIALIGTGARNPTLRRSPAPAAS